MKTLGYQRFIARNIDYVLIGVFINLITSIVPINMKTYSLLNNEYVFVIIVCFVFIPFEILQLYYFKTTIGKKFFGFSVSKKNGENITFNDAIKRSFFVWFEGIGCAIPAVNFITILFSFNYLEKNEETPWDRQLNLKLVKE